MDRGATDETTRERHRREDDECTAGARNAALIVPGMAPLLDTVSQVRDTLLRVMDEEPGLRDCHLACGTAPARQPPDEQLIDVARRAVCEAMGVTDPERTAALQHSASPLRYGISGP